MHTQSLARRAIGIVITVGVFLVPAAIASPARADSTGPAVSLDDATELESGGSLSVRVHLSVSGNAPVEVHYTTRHRTARAGTDFTYTRGSVVFAPGETEQWVVVPIIDDAVPEATETFRVVIRGVGGATVADRRATATIHDDDWVGTPNLSQSTGLAHLQPVRVRARGLSAGLTVYLHECEGSVSAAHPYPVPCDAQLGGPIVVDPHGRIDVTVSVLRYFPFYDGIQYDCAFEGCSLWLGIGAVDDSAIGTPVELHFAQPNPVPKISIDSMTVVEGTGTFTTAQLRLHLDRPATGPVVLFLMGVDATATQADYDVNNRGVSIPVGATDVTFDLYITADSIHEGTEVFGVAPRSVSGATFGDGFPGALVVISDDD